MGGNNFKILSIASMIIGIILIFLSAFIYPNLKNTSNLLVYFSLILGMVCFFYPIFFWLLVSKSKINEIQNSFEAMKKYRLIPINEFLFFFAFFLVVAVSSAYFYKNSWSFLQIIGVLFLIFLISVFIQYHRGLIELYKSKNK